jgi:hypothetical protein
LFVCFIDAHAGHAARPALFAFTDRSEEDDRESGKMGPVPAGVAGPSSRASMTWQEVGRVRIEEGDH